MHDLEVYGLGAWIGCMDWLHGLEFWGGGKKTYRVFQKREISIIFKGEILGCSYSFCGFFLLVLLPLLTSFDAREGDFGMQWKLYLTTME
jgi:hypothetical protein